MIEDEELLAELKAATCGLLHIKHSLAYKSLGSTNDEAMELLKAGAKSGTVIMASSQLRGRGRLSRSWHSKSGDIAMSIVLCRPSLPDEEWLLPMIPALAVLRALEFLGLQAMLKWPNDIVLVLAHEIKKFGGILIENAFDERGLKASIIGIGLNIENRPDMLKEVPHAGFLKSYLPLISRKMVISGILHELDAILSAMKEPDFKYSLLKEYEDALATIGRRVLISTEKGEIQALAKGIGPQGSLLVNDGKSDRLIFAGDVNFKIGY